MDKSPVPLILTHTVPPASSNVRSKAIYVISGLLKHNGHAVEALTPEEWAAILSTLTGMQ